MVHKKLKHFLASFFLAFDWRNFLIAIQNRSFNFMDFESNSRSKKNLLTRKAMNNGAKKMAHLLCTISSLLAIWQDVVTILLFCNDLN